MRPVRYSDLPPNARQAIREMLAREDHEDYGGAPPMRHRAPDPAPRVWRRPQRVKARFIHYVEPPRPFRALLVDVAMYLMGSMLGAVLLEIIWHQCRR